MTSFIWTQYSLPLADTPVSLNALASPQLQCTPSRQYGAKHKTEMYASHWSKGHSSRMFRVEFLIVCCAWLVLVMMVVVLCWQVNYSWMFYVGTGSSGDVGSVVLTGELQLDVLCWCCTGLYCIFCRQHAVTLWQLWSGSIGTEKSFPLLDVVCSADTAKILHTVTVYCITTMLYVQLP